MKKLPSVELEGNSVLYKIGADRITLTMEELIAQLSKYNIAIAIDISVPVPKNKCKCQDYHGHIDTSKCSIHNSKKKIYHDISCNCYDCRNGVSCKAKD